MLKMKLAAAFAALVFLGAVADAAFANSPPAKVTATARRPRVLDWANNGKTISIRNGESVVVKLRGNASTGYFWRVKAVRGGLRQIGRTTYVNDVTVTPTVGQPGTSTSRFLAAGNGQGSVELEYVGPGHVIAKTFKVTINVRP